MKKQNTQQTNLGNFPKPSKKEVFELETSTPTIYNDLEEEDEFSPDQVLRKYRKLPRSVNVPKYGIDFFR